MRTPPACAARCRRSRRREQLRAAALVLPLFLFLAACFVVPIGAMLSRGVIDTDIARILPAVTAALKNWDGRDLPPESAYAALIADIRAAREAGYARERGDAAQLRRSGFSHAVLQRPDGNCRPSRRDPRAMR